MTKINIHKDNNNTLTNPNAMQFEVVERKFRGHPDSLADMVAHRFTQLYIEKTWDLFPELNRYRFPNFSADKITLSGASTDYNDNKFYIYKPIDAFLIGKVTRKIGKEVIDLDEIFERSILEVLSKALGHTDFIPYVNREIYAANKAGVDHNKGFYNPDSTKDLLAMLAKETHANDTVYVVAYAPLTITEQLAIYLDNYSNSTAFKDLFPEIGTDIKAMIRKRDLEFDITLCLPIFPEKVDNISKYEEIIGNATRHLTDVITAFLKEKVGNTACTITLQTNTKDTKDKKYFAVWGTALSKADIGAVGRGNRQQGFISGMRPSTNEAMSGKNPNHFAGIIYQLIAEEITDKIYKKYGIENTVYITANNGDELRKPHSIDIVIGEKHIAPDSKIQEVISESLENIDVKRKEYISSDYFRYFMKQNSL